MKNNNTKRVFAAMLMLAVVTIIMTVSAAADNTAISDALAPVVDLIKSILNTALILVGALGALYCVFLGVKFAKAEEPQDREKAKAHLKNAIIGFVLIFVLMFALRALMPVMINWVNSNSEAAAFLHF